MCEVSCSVQLAQGGLQEYAFGSFTSTPAVYTKKCIMGGYNISGGGVLVGGYNISGGVQYQWGVQY